MTTDRSPWRPHIVVVGGFLGAGKTSLILAAAKLLTSQGRICAVILNDQGQELVDTRYASLAGIDASEVTGGCFCCRLSELQSAIEQLRELRPHIIFAEPVGSCTDIAATVLAPLREEFERFTVAPFSVLVDPSRAATLGNPEADSNAAFLFEKQIEEADLVLMSKSDLYPLAASAFGLRSRFISSKTGKGLQEWISEVFIEGAALRGLEIDYAQYARAEASLAWVNLSFTFTPSVPAIPAQVAGSFMDDLDRALTAAEISVMHLKLLNHSPSGWVKAAICANGDEPSVEGQVDASPADRHEMLLNLRALAAPDRVRKILNQQIEKMNGNISNLRLDCFSPAPPVPERRIVQTTSI